MDESSLLLEGVEVSVALAGFAGIVATFQFRDNSKVRRGDMVGLTMLVSFSLVIAFFCALPLALGVFSIRDTTIWAVTSSLGAIYVFNSMWFVHRRMHSVRMKARTRRLFAALQAVAGLLAVLNILNAANVGFSREPGPHIASLLFGLCLVGYMFVRLLVRPLWKVVHDQEAQSVGTD